MRQILAPARFSRGVATACAVVLLLSGAPAAGVRSEPVATPGLRTGDEAFWDGPQDIEQPVPLSAEVLRLDEQCSVDPTRCLDYPIEVLEPAGRLRVAFDTPDEFDADHGDAFNLYLYDPEGQLIGSAGQQPAAGIPTLYRYSGEVYAEAPQVGTWTARMFVFQASDATFRMRAKLEAYPPPVKKRRILLPNLRALPPFDLTFATPLASNALGWSPTSDASPTQGCSAGEVAEPQVSGSPPPTRCLRFNIGPENIGAGGLLLHFVPGSDPMRGEVIQQIEYSEGPDEERSAGTYEYEAQHAHYHAATFHSMELFRVTDEKKGTLEHAGDGPKMGFCMGDYLIAEWTSFANDEGTTPSSCVEPLVGTTIGLSRGWADAYPQNVPGNYVEFGDNPDGLYVVRVKVNHDDSIHESSYRDNYSYTFIEVSEGDTIEVLERGYGLSPWDHHKVLSGDIRLGVSDD